MHGFPDDLDPSIFVGTELQNVSFGIGIVNLTFSGIHVGMEASYEHRGPTDEGWTDRASGPPTTSRLMMLCGHTVADAEILDRRRLRLTFDHGHSLTLIDDREQYESGLLGHLTRVPKLVAGRAPWTKAAPRRLPGGG